ncbi:Innexin, partial [Caligus rogercresseyi]
MFDVFGSVKILIKIDSICIDNNVFRLHYKATVILLIILHGDPIDCIVEEIPPNVMDTYCWIHSTFSIVDNDRSNEEPQQFTNTINGHSLLSSEVPMEDWEGGKMSVLVQEMNVPILDNDTKKDRIRLLVDYFSVNRFNHQFYTLKFFFCEFLNFANVISQIFFTDFFLGGQFTTYGSDVLAMTELEPEQRSDPLSRVFPKMTKCTFHKF